MLLQRMRALLFLTYITLGLTACSDFTTESESIITEDPGVDVVAPFVVSSYPEADTTDFEIDSLIRFEFSELMNLDVLENGNEVISDNNRSAAIVLYSGKAIDGAVFQLSDERPINNNYSVKLGVGVDPITNNDIDIDVTTLTLQHESGRFALNNEYTVYLSEEALDLADDLKTEFVTEGNKLGRNIELSFQTEDGEWKEDTALIFRGVVVTGDDPVLLEGGQFEPSLTSNDKGDVISVWRQSQSGGDNDVMGIWGSRYLTSENAWVVTSDNTVDNALVQNAERLDDPSSDANAFEPKAVINKQGKVVVTWYQAPVGSAIEAVWVNSFDESFDINGDYLGYQWGVAEDISNNQAGGSVLSPQVGIDDAGNVLSVWLENDGDTKLVRTSYFDVATQVRSGPLTLNSAFSSDAKQPSLTMSPTGGAFLSWAQEEAGVYNIYASRFVGGIWGEPQKLNNSSSPALLLNNSSKPHVVIDNNSDAIVVWQQHDGTRENIWSSRFAGGVWGTSFLMEENNVGDAIDPFIALGANNQALAIWVQAKKIGVTIKDSVVAKSYSVESGWSSVEELFEGNVITKPSVRFDFEGNAVASWLDDDSIERARYSKLTSTWLGLAANSPNANNVRSVNMSPLLQDGRFLSVWTEYKDGSFKLFSSIFKD